MKADPMSEPAQCPEGSSLRLYRDGLRYLSGSENVQRWLCRDCGYRFSEKQVEPLQETSKQSIIGHSAIVSNYRLSAILQQAKKLDTTETKTIAGESPRLTQAKGLVTQFMAYMEKEGYSEETQYPAIIKRLAKIGANLLDPENVKEVIGKQKMKNGTKIMEVCAYAAFANMLKIPFDPPKYHQEEHLPFIPDEKELDQLISFCHGKRMAAFLQCFKETYADPGEALRIRWIDILGNIITINRPVKGHLSRQLEVSNKLIAMLNALPRKSERVFPVAYSSIEALDETCGKSSIGRSLAVVSASDVSDVGEDKVLLCEGFVD
jgi:integrase